jgi:hypothetical protein
MELGGWCVGLGEHGIFDGLEVCFVIGVEDAC